MAKREKGSAREAQSLAIKRLNKTCKRRTIVTHSSLYMGDAENAGTVKAGPYHFPGT